ncbi:MAG: hypothetical protein MMC33_004713 [Icmadophila ericetorum]|nr:hypothetical protein [Icmadophila ericetorum]
MSKVPGMEVEATPKQPEALKKLPALVNTVLIQIGKAFRDSAKENGKPSAYAKGKNHQIIPQANREFHSALDEIESSILRSKAVFERDIAILRAKRAEREKAAGALRLRESSKEVQGSGDSPTKPVDGAILEGINCEDGQATDGMNLDVDMLEFVQKSEGDGLKDEFGNETVRDGNNESLFGSPVKDEEDNKTIELAQQQPSDFIQMGEGGNAEPQSANPDDQEINFESMFTDADMTGGGSEINFDLEFPMNENMGQGPLNTTNPFVDLTSHPENFSNQNTTSNEDINKLLPGLENYITAGDDFGLSNLPDINTVIPGNTATQTTDAGNTAITTQDTMMDSSFDDMFYGTGDLDFGGSDNGMGFGDFPDFGGDDFFKSDGNG